MGSGIPLPALDVKPVQQPNLAETYGNILRLKMLAQQQQMMPGQLQAQQLENQQRQQAVQIQQQQIKATQTLQQLAPQYVKRDADGKPAGYDYEGLQTAALNAGIPAPMLDQITTMRKNAADALLAEANVKGKSLEQQKAVLDQAYQHYEGIRGVTDPTKRQANWNAALDWAKSAGADVSHLPQQVPDDAGLTSIEAGLGMHAQAQADAAKQAEIAQSQAKTGESQAQTEKIRLEMGTGKAAYEQTLADLQQGKQVTPDRIAAARAYEASESKTSSSSDAYGVKSTNVSRPTGLSEAMAASHRVAGNGTPAPIQSSEPPQQAASGMPTSVVDQVGMGKMAATRMEMLLSRSPALMEAVARKYPDFDSSKVKGYADAYRSFTSGADAKQVNAGAVAIQHLADLKKINDENPTESRIPGTAAYKAFHNLLDTVADELVTFYGEPRTNEAMDSKKSTLGGTLNRNAAILEQAKAMGIKMDEMEQKWQNAAPSKSYQAPMPGMSDKAKQARAALDPEFAQRQQGSGQQSGAPIQGGGLKINRDANGRIIGIE